MGPPEGNQNAVGNEGGRPSQYKPEYPELARRLCERLGATDAQLAQFFGVHRATIFRWRDEHPEFAEAIKLGKDVANENVKRSLYQRAMGYDYQSEKVFFDKDGPAGKRVVRAETMEHVPGDVAAMRYWLQNRDPESWRDRRELTGKDGEPFTPPLIQISRYEDDDKDPSGS